MFMKTKVPVWKVIIALVKAIYKRPDEPQNLLGVNKNNVTCTHLQTNNILVAWNFLVKCYIYMYMLCLLKIYIFIKSSVDVWKCV